jgi:hypothetical protein
MNEARRKFGSPKPKLQQLRRISVGIKKSMNIISQLISDTSVDCIGIDAISDFSDLGKTFIGRDINFIRCC